MPEKLEPAQNNGQNQKAVAVIFIHGIGVQDRYQQLTSFVKGLRTQAAKQGEFEVEEVNPDLPKGNSIPTRITQKDGKDGAQARNVDFYEVFWGPLLNGMTNQQSVLRWIMITLSQMLPWNSKRIARVCGAHALEGQEKSTHIKKWAYTISYAAFFLAFAAFAFYWSIGLVVLASDQIASPRANVIQSSEFRNKDWKAGANEVEGAKNDFEYYFAHPVQLSSFTPYRNDFKHRVTLYTDFTFQALTYLPTRLTPSDASQQTAAADAYASGRRWRYDNESRRTARGLTLDTQTFLKQIEPRDLVCGVLYVAWALSFLKAAGRLFIGLPFAWRKQKKQLKAPFTRHFKHIDDEERRVDFKQEAFRLSLWVIALVFIGLAVAAMNKPVMMMFFIPFAFFRLLYTGMKRALTDILGDVEIYVTRDENSAKYAGREAVIKRALDQIGQIAKSEKYEAVYIAGHSLGSVVGLDALRRLYIDYALAYEGSADNPTPEMLAYEKIRAFISFGSPLLKTLLFFHKSDYKSEFGEFNREVDSRLFLEGAFDKDCRQNPAFQPKPHCLLWFNFWMFYDIVSDPLHSSYPIRPFRDRPLSGNRSLWPHSDYWHDPIFAHHFLRIVSSVSYCDLMKVRLDEPIAHPNPDANTAVVQMQAQNPAVPASAQKSAKK